MHLAGVSEGGLVATLLAERSPELFSTALAACAPIGSFVQQINYLGDFRVLFDYFFPGVIPGSPVVIPPGVIANWAGTYLPAVQRALAANPSRAVELMRVSHVAYDAANPVTIVQSAANVLTYNVLGANDARAVLGGNPYGNRGRWYFGSSNDLRLNLFVKRFDADPAALAAMGAVRDQRQPEAFRSSPSTPPPTTSPRWRTSCSTCRRSTPRPAACSCRCRFSVTATATSPRPRSRWPSCSRPISPDARPAARRLAASG